jgi:hypothetical protein
MDGEVAFVRERAGAPEVMALWGGTELRWGDHALRGQGRITGTVTGVIRRDEGARRDALIVTGDIPANAALAGITVIVTFGDGSTYGYPLQRVEREQYRTLLVLDGDPGFTMMGDGSRHSYFPLRSMPGEVTFQIRTCAFSDLRAAKER